MGIGYDAARHFVSRTGIGTPPSEVARYAKLDRDSAISALLETVKLAATTEMPTWVAEKAQSREVLMTKMGDPKEVQELLRDRSVQLKAWWLREMVATDSPFTERMTLFWHNHFTSSIRKVRRPKLLARQNETLRKHALGKFSDLTRQMLRDPAMLVYLDNVQNSARRPNENLARELMELFTLGEGHYSERDVKEAARALTGATVSRRDGTFRNAKWRHDDGEKTFLGHTGRFGPDELVDIILKRKQCSRFIAEKLWGEFVTTDPTKRDIDAVAGELRRTSYDIARAVAKVLESEAFWADENVGSRIKSPVEYIVGTARTLGLKVPDDRMLVRTSRALGQDVFDPPNVKGWDGGERWIDSNALLRRVQIASRAVNLPSELSDPERWSAGVWPGEPLHERVRRILLAVRPVAVPDASNPRAYVRSLTTDPAYQLG